jgi:hypothetical protein
MDSSSPEYQKKYYLDHRETILKQARERYLKYKADGTIEKKKQRTLELQRIRFHNPVVREKHRIACIKSKEKKSHSSNLVSLANIKVGEFDLSFD